MNIVDTSGWIAFLNGEGNAAVFAEPLQDTERLLVPTICIYEMFKFTKIKKGKAEAIKIAAHMKQGRILELNEKIAMEAALISIDYKMAMADSLIYASARIADALIWTQDKDFKGLPSVKYYPKK